MRRVVLVTLATVVGLVLLLGFKSHGTPGPRAAALAPGATSGTGGRAGGGHLGGRGGTRTVTGAAVATPYGPVQVSVTTAGGRITRVTPVQLPQSTGTDVQIDDYAVPQLVQETIAAQSAHIDGVSGATYTSDGYLQSLQSALDKLHR